MIYHRYSCVIRVYIYIYNVYTHTYVCIYIYIYNNNNNNNNDNDNDNNIACARQSGCTINDKGQRQSVLSRERLCYTLHTTRVVPTVQCVWSMQLRVQPVVIPSLELKQSGQPFLSSGDPAHENKSSVDECRSRACYAQSPYQYYPY